MLREAKAARCSSVGGFDYMIYRVRKDMLDNYGLLIYWDVDNNRYVAQVSTSELLTCSATGRTRKEALEELESEVEAWYATARRMQPCVPSADTPHPETRPLLALDLIEPASKGAENSTVDFPKISLAGLHIEQTALYSVSCVGIIDIYNSSAMHDVLERMSNASERCIIVDLSEVSSIDSSGLNVLLQAYKRCKAVDGALLLVLPTVSDINRLLQITRLNSLFTIQWSLAEAVKTRRDFISTPV